MIRRRLFLGLALTGCFPRGQSSEREPRSSGSALIVDVPHVRQKPDFCGEACAAMVLTHLGFEADQDDVFDVAGLDPSLGRGCHTPELARAVERLGFDPGPIWTHVPGRRQSTELDDAWDALVDDLTLGIPSICCMRFGDPPSDSEHFRLVVGYDQANDEVVYHDPAVDDGGYLRMTRARFVSLWPLKYERSRWLLVRLRMERDGVSVPPRAKARHRPADFAQHVLARRERLEDDRFTAQVEAPFVVWGDESAPKVAQRAENTVRWAVDRLKQAYFDTDPDEILDVWLFKDKKSYGIHAWKLFHERPDTPYGYYSPKNRALVMNIATGGGTLVHEIVHPFMRANFPEAPSWFDEGLASLYEQCGDKDGKIHGFVNWRLDGLQSAIAAGTVPSFRSLTSRSFYDDDPGTNYSQARYLCYYLQERGLLTDFYRAFRSSHDKDPTGYRTLQDTVGYRDMRRFKRDWEAFVSGLKFA